MKYNIVFKFIAVLLCAATLLGAIGSGVGIFALTEMGLYDKTVDQVYRERVESQGRSFADELAMEFTSKNLGGFTDSMMESVTGMVTGYFRHDFEPGYFGYALKDYEGNVLDSQELSYPEGAVTYTFDISGQYMYLVEVVPQEQPAAAEAYYGVGDNPVIYDAVPADGAVVGQLEIRLANDSVHGYGEDNLGTVFYNQDGMLVFRCAPSAVEISAYSATITEIYLWNSYGDLLYQAASPEGVGSMRYAEDGSNDLIFTSSFAREFAVAEAEIHTPTVEETLPEVTVPETTAVEESVPETTAAAENIPEETAASAAEDETAPASEDETDSASEEAEATAEKKAKKKKSAETESEEKKAEENTSEEKVSEEKKTDEGKSEEKASEEKKSDEKADKEDAAAEKSSSEEGSAAEPAAHAEDSEAEPASEGTEVTEAPTEAMQAETIPPETIPEETIPEQTEPMMINGKTLDSYQINRVEYYDTELGQYATAKYVYVPMPAMTVELYVAPGALRYDAVYTVLRLVREVRSYLLPAIGVCLLLFVILAVYLCCAAGRKPKTTEVMAGGLNRMPLDLYGGMAFLSIGFLCVAIGELGDNVLRQNVMVGCAFITAMAYLACLIFVGFCFAFVAQFKTPGGFWWRNSLCGWCLKLVVYLWNLLIRFAIRLEEWLAVKGLPLLKRLFKWLWGLIVTVWLWFWASLKRIYHWMYSGFNRFYSLLPLTWQWLLTGIAIVLLLFLSIATRSEGMLVLCLCASFAVILYGAHCFGVLLESTKKMNKGNLDSKVDDKLMVGSFKEFAGDLNDLAGVAVVAAQKQLKSERMKTELITNVSHDIKTPLTSIINYVDLLQKPHTEEEEQQYLDVLDRQSQRLKKLIGDLIDMSKASTGNMAVDITIVDAVESVNQALGEFADKLDKVQLTPVFRHTEESVPMLADGRLVWRVMSNLLSNAVKYALPGTRLYIDLMSLEGKVVISLKNISRDELNVDAEELMERFVRGDDSRNTEGSGLGLNIAKSLMELQKGQLQLLVDGDLFKVTLIFPGVQ